MTNEVVFGSRQMGESQPQRNLRITQFKILSNQRQHAQLKKLLKPEKC
jgi:hypothetical protein